MKKQYIKPSVISNSSQTNVIPVAVSAAAAVSSIAPGLALLAGYAAGRSVKKAFGVGFDEGKFKNLEKVHVI